MPEVPSTSPPIDLDYQLADNLLKDEGRVFLTGTQALVRLLLAQHRLDRRNGLDTGGFVSGYRGSPLAGVGFELWRIGPMLQEAGIVFVPGVNEDLAATAVMGSQHAGVDAARMRDGVFGMWYGKGPGLDRAGDALRHGNAAGASRHGGVLMVVGDDHAATSSSIPNASDLSLIGWGVPIVHPASVAEYQEFGLWGWAASRFAGTWVAFKAISETVESGRSVTLSPLPTFVEPAGFVSSVGPLEFRTSDFLTAAIEQRLAEKLRALSAFAALNSLDKLIVDPPRARVGIVTVGKAHLDLMEVLERGGLTNDRLIELGVRIYKPGLTWPLDRSRLLAFADGLTHLLVVEEKAAVVEQQVKDLLFNQPAARRPRVVGRHDDEGRPLIPWVGQLRPALLAAPVYRWLSAALERDFDEQAARAAGVAPVVDTSDPRRLPYFCAGCPHNSSTRVPDGSTALAGVGCHYMASWMDRGTGGLTQMGGEGADWVGWSPFTRTAHVFQNMGEGTYFHSGLLAIRQAIAARANITYKILFNDAVAMTGGQPVDGTLTVPQICTQLVAEGARRVVVTTDEPARYRGVTLPAGVDVLHRRELDRLQRELRETAGVTALIHDQTCAAEKRRRRKRAEYPDPPRRLFINEAVCEACGDCGVQSNCVAIVPQPTPFGTKRRIDQSACNKDWSCAEGFCPSFVSVIGGRPRKAAPDGAGRLQALLARARALAGPDVTISTAAAPSSSASSSSAAPSVSSTTAPSAASTTAGSADILIAGVGGTGVITIGAVLAMAAHLEGKAVSVLDFTALAQKGGSVLSHLRIGPPARADGAVRIDWQRADTLIACDLVVGTLPDAIGAIRAGHTTIVGNRNVASLAEFTRDGDALPDADALMRRLSTAAGEGAKYWLDATVTATALFGDSIATNCMMLGVAWQLGRVPVSAAAIIRALELNGVAVQINQQAFAGGRALADERFASNPTPPRPGAPLSSPTIRTPATPNAIAPRCAGSRRGPPMRSTPAMPAG